MNHDDLPDPITRDDFYASSPTAPHEETGHCLEDVLAQHLHDVDAEHALLLRMWNTPHPADDESTPDDDASAAGDVPKHAAAGLEAAPGHVTVLHQARALTVGDLRAALLGVPDDRPIAIDVPLDPGGFELHRHVLTITGGAYLLLADEEEVLDPSFVLRTDFSTGLYELPTDTTPGAAGTDPR
ncbi:DUF6225 family protein [Kineococcus rubinsiae]|uniref:DUF6225 family protein n=1 Tax=Kineococcus rubinsiae TaxID=2609562 RepID=UPI00142F8E5A|nr:DUF6225 family protein [Kineococcus rubinsiae]NIZ90293.1 hypothetical protein [Kineococcus rubinsiae]